mmetsp:Transcript_122564/g.357914  ORF Transcript_122564/g.357914 Transcript_122564/m.357914 type:complete len:354 (-) Transcript_122564:90-1151(-)
MGKKKTAEVKPAEEPKEVKVEAPPAEEEEEDSPKVKELKALDDRCLEIEKKFRAEVEVLRKKYSEEQEPILEERSKALAAKGDGADEASGTPGLPDFWLQALQRHPATEELVEEWDVPVLKYLRNVTRSYIDTTDPSKGFRLEFHFAENPYFTEEVLWKEYHIGEIAPYTDDVKAKEIAVCEISWKPGKNVTVEVVKTKPKGGSKKKAAKAQEKEEPRDSFFRNVFRPLKLGMPLPPDMNLNDARQLCGDESEDEDDGDDKMLELLMENDYEMGRQVRDQLIPFAIRFYTGEAVPEQSLDDDDDDEDDEEEDDDSEDEDDEPPPAKGKKPQGKRKGGGGPMGAVGKQEDCKQQ